MEIKDTNPDESEELKPQGTSANPEVNSTVSINDSQKAHSPESAASPSLKDITERNSQNQSAAITRKDTFSPIPASIDNPQNLPPVVVDVQGNPNVKEPSLPVIGYNLASFVLLIISGFVLLLIIFLYVKEFDASKSIQIPVQTNIPDSTFARKIEVAKLIQEEKKGMRDFTVQIAQMILLNLLLPVLTAILGYIFASNKNKE